ncbi:hypothetical protein PCANC_01594 [Puccinia coronata f. sp. avenae]|uniref:S-adenosylmethionine decarboxylase proenzyme n=1 Tax=Puccinia coronata f. sp. avenae TaxID=200324 RepID=A0A2N5W0L0_9BASI|nr:hypothetical protein PCANC_22636 [Puccinia coronata f. sp. avenae]PLW55747.1 hypothetical protein PCANC_01594 [Puccinia coronata f. sp. avenae]
MSNDSPFEGPEKLLEIWFTPTEEDVPKDTNTGSREPLTAHPSHQLTGLRTVLPKRWDKVLTKVQCKALSIMESQYIDSYLLSESSMFVWPHKIILKTCGTTSLLLGLEELLKIAKDECGLSSDVYRVFYSHTTFKFPKQQSAPHTAWHLETAFLDKIFGLKGTDRILGEKSPWHLYYKTAPSSSKIGDDLGSSQLARLDEQDSTLEILMTGLSRRAARHFELGEDLKEGKAAGNQLAKELKIDAPSLLAGGATDGWFFSPCGFSANLLGGPDEKRYATFHVTPEESHSYASYETNYDYTNRPSQLRNGISHILKTFEPKETTITLFISHTPDHPTIDAKRSLPELNEKLDELLEDDLRHLYTLDEKADHKLDDYNLFHLTLKRVEDSK